MNICTVSAGLMMASVIVSLSDNSDNSLSKQLEQVLDDKQKNIYKEIKDERWRIYLQSQVIALVLITLYNHLSGKQSICVTTFTYFTATYLSYILHPKSKYMVSYLTTEEQRNKWLKVNNNMKYKYHAGYLLGIVAYLVLYYRTNNMPSYTKVFMI